MEAVVELRGVVKAFNHRAGAPFKAIDGVSLDLRRGETVGLLGPNGAGKTTLIHMLLGLLLPTEGSIRVFGLDMPARRKEILRRANFSSAYVQLPYSLTPRENLHVFARMYGLAQPRRRAAELLERMELAELADRPTRALSSGQLSRLNLAKSLLNDPELLLLDEPTASMDPDIAEKTRGIISAYQAERKTTVLYTSHNMREVQQLASRLVFLQRGRLVADGAPDELLRRFREADLEKVFLKLAREG